MTFAVDCALKTNYLSLRTNYLSIYLSKNKQNSPSSPFKVADFSPKTNKTHHQPHSSWLRSNHHDMTFAVDCALKTNYLSLRTNYLSIYLSKNKQNSPSSPFKVADFSPKTNKTHHQPHSSWLRSNRPDMTFAVDCVQNK